jgi:hypothetical protein
VKFFKKKKLMPVIKERKINTIMPVSDMQGSTIRVLSNRSEEARDWTNTYTLVGHQAKSAYDLGTLLATCDAVISVWGIAGVGKSTLVRSVFCHAMLGLRQSVQTADGRSTDLYGRHGFTMYSWVDVPHPFNLTDFSRCLLLDFHSDDIQAKEAAAVGIVQGQDPIQACRRILHEHKCLVVMDGLRSTDDWDLIKAAFLPDSTESRIIVVTNEKKLAMHCVHKEAQVVNVKGLNSHSALNLFNKVCFLLTMHWPAILHPNQQANFICFMHASIYTFCFKKCICNLNKGKKKN